jgi:hypothetical protein
MSEPIKHDVRSVDRISVIRIVHLRGAGTASDPVREVVTYWTDESGSGVKLFEIDSCAGGER